MSTASAAKPGNSSPSIPTAKAGGKAGGNPFALPPDEQFWQRYSPHFELPISGVGSVLLHFLPFAILIALAILGIGFGGSREIPFDVVRIPGGGGGNPGGKGDGPNVGGPLVEDPQNRDVDPPDIQLPDTPPLSATEVKDAREKFADNEDAKRYINAGNENIAKIARNLNREFLDKAHVGLMPGQGQGGKGSGGGEGDGHGTGKGSGIGAGDGGKLDQRTKRMLRWVMVFETHNPSDYVKQLAGLGAILAIPTGNKDYKLIKDLNARPAKLESEDIASLNRIYWVDDKPQSADGVLHVLGLNMHAGHFVAFMPQDLERRLGEMELAYKGLNEDDIHETKFRVFKTGAGYDVKVQSQSRK